MQSIVDTTFMLTIAALFPISLMFIAHTAAKRYGIERGLLKYRYALITFVIGFFLYFFGTGLYVAFWTSTISDFNYLMIRELVGMGFGVIIMVMCHGVCIVGGPSLPV
jgi:hypothetical protein